MPFASTRPYFIINPQAAGGRTKQRWARNESALRERFPAMEVLHTTGPRDGIALAESAAVAGADLVVAVGGDGTLHEVINGLVRVSQSAAGRPVLGILPSGTGCDFARTLGVGPSFEAAVGQLLRADCRSIDVGWCAHPGDAAAAEAFLNVASVGVTAEVVRMLSNRRRLLPAKLSYYLSAVRGLLGFRNANVRLTVDGGEVEARCIKAIALGNGCYFGAGMCIAPEAAPDSGELQVATFGDLGRFEAVRRLQETYRGKRIQHPRVDYRFASEVVIEPTEGRTVGVELDGELWGDLPARFTVEPRALRVLTT